MLAVDPSRVRAVEIAQQLLIGRARGERVLPQDIEKILDFGPQSRRRDPLRILPGLPRESESPVHQPGSSLHSSIGVVIPSTIDSVIPGMDWRWMVS